MIITNQDVGKHTLGPHTKTNHSTMWLHLDCRSARHTQEIKLPTNQKAMTIPRPLLESSRQGESRSAVTIFVKSMFGVLFFETCEKRVPTKIVTPDLESPR